MVLVLLGGFVLSAPAQADADADLTEAKRLFHSATTLYNLGEYDQALAQFKAAYKLKSDPAFLFNIAQCQRQIPDYLAAEKSYRAFLREMPDAPQKVRDDVGRLADEMAAAAKAQRASRPSTGGRAADAEPRTREPTTGGVAPPPSPPPQAVTPPPEHADLTANAPSPMRTPVYKKWWLWTTVAVIAAGAGVGLGIGLSSGGDNTRVLPPLGGTP